MIDFLLNNDPGDESPGTRAYRVIVYLVLGLLLLGIINQVTVPAQQAAPGYNGNTWHTEITIEDNDTNVCVGFCPDGQR